MTHETSTVAPERAAAPVSRDETPKAADVLVVFGITGDLAKVMTFRSLYRLEARGLLTARSSASPSTTGPSTS